MHPRGAGPRSVPHELLPLQPGGLQLCPFYDAVFAFGITLSPTSAVCGVSALAFHPVYPRGAALGGQLAVTAWLCLTKPTETAPVPLEQSGNAESSCSALSQITPPSCLSHFFLDIKA